MASGSPETIVERRRLALDLRQAGLCYRDIATTLTAKGYPCTLSTAYTDVKAELAELKRLTKEAAEQVREMELNRLDTALKALMPKILKGHEGAIDRMLRIQERRSKYLGLDTPTKVENLNYNAEVPELDTPEDEKGRLDKIRKKIDEVKTKINGNETPSDTECI